MVLLEMKARKWIRTEILEKLYLNLWWKA